jgi:DNA-directed RNA polymerase subunit RPC12/RpoP
MPGPPRLFYVRNVLLKMQVSEGVPGMDELEIRDVECPECGWIGMSDDCCHGLCPHCGGRVKRDRRFIRVSVRNHETVPPPHP